MPRIDDTIEALNGSQYFTTLDLFSGYWQIEIDEPDKHKPDKQLLYANMDNMNLIECLLD